MSDLTPNINTNLFKIDPEQMAVGKRVGNIKPISKEQAKKEFNTFEPINLENIRHIKELHSLFPPYLIKECNEDDWKLFMSMSRFDRRNNTFIVGCFNNRSIEFELIAYKWKLKDGKKWKTRAGTSPNSTALVRIFTDGKTIYVLEGHRDSLTAVLLGLDFIMLPYAGYRISNPSYLQKEVTDREVIFLVEDEAAYKCMKRVAEQLKPTAKKIQMKQLDKTDSKVDLSDFVNNFNTIQEVIDGLRN